MASMAEPTAAKDSCYKTTCSAPATRHDGNLIIYYQGANASGHGDGIGGGKTVIAINEEREGDHNL